MREAVSKMKPIGMRSEGMLTMCIYDFIHESDGYSYAIVGWTGDAKSIRKYKLYESMKRGSYMMYKGKRYYLDEFLRV